MPEWCLNVLRIEGDDVKQCLDSCMGLDGKGNQRFDFNKIIPMPDALRSRGAEGIGRNAIAAFEQTGLHDWYDWSITNWNTKWNSDFTTVEGIEAKKVTIRFCSAWSPPLPVIRALSKKFPAMLFSLAYEQSQAGFQGKLICSAGKDLINDCDAFVVPQFDDDEAYDEFTDPAETRARLEELLQSC